MRTSPVAPVTKVTMRTSDRYSPRTGVSWWTSSSDSQLQNSLVGTADFLKKNQTQRFRMAAIYARLYGNMSLFSFIGSNLGKLSQDGSLPVDRPTFNLVQSATDTLVSRIGQSRPSPVFLTDNSDYKERNLAKKLNNFIQGEFFQLKAYEKAPLILRDALIEGSGCLHVYEHEKKVAMERVLLTELMVDPNEAMYGDPRQLYRLKLVDRKVLEQIFGKKIILQKAEQAYVDSSADAAKTVSDLVMVVEGWHLPSGKDAKDGRHTIACSAGVLFDETYTKPTFPFVFLQYCPPMLGFWAQGLAQQLMGTQLEINSLLYTISKAIKLIGVPRVFEEVGSKVLGASHNNDIGAIIKYQGTKPSYEVAECNAPELYVQLERLIKFGYQQCGVSALDAGAQKPAGLNSGEAIRSYDDISTDRFAALSRRYDTFFIDLAYLVVDLAKDIAKRDGKYSTVYPNKNGTKQIDLPKASILEDAYVIQAYNMSSLPKDPAGRLQKITEMISAGMLSIKEGRRLLDYPDLEQIEKLANASEERIFQYLDKIVEDGEYTPPDPFMNLDLAEELSIQYYNLYVSAKLEEDRAQMLMDFFNQVQDLKQSALPQAPQGPTPDQPQVPAPTIAPPPQQTAITSQVPAAA